MAVEVASVFAKLGLNASEFKSGMQSAHSELTSFGDKLQGMGKSAMKVGGVMSAAITAPLVAAGAKMFQSAAQFETGMNVMTLAAKSSGTSMEQLRAATIKVGGDTELVGINAAQAADAMTNFYKAGLSTNQIMGDMEGYLAGNVSLSGALRAAIDMAAASEYDLSAASEAVSVAMATFGIKAEDATQITDLFVRAADASVASVPEMNEAIKNIGSTFNAFYSSTMTGTEQMGQLNTALAILSQRGIKGAEAGTALKSMMTNMMRTTDEVQLAYQQLGVTLYDTEGRLKQMPTIIAELSAALDTNAVRTIQVSKLTGEQGKELDRLQKIYNNAARSVQDYGTGVKGAGQSEKARGNALAKLNATMAAAQAEMAPLIALSNEKTTVTKKLTEQERNQYVQTLAGTYGMKAMNTLLTEGTEGWDKMTASIGAAADTQAAAGARTKGLGAAWENLQGVIETLILQGTSPFMESLAGIVRGAADLVSKLVMLDPIWFKLAGGIALALAAAGPIVTVFGALATVVGFLLSPIGLIVAAVVALGAAFVNSQGGIMPALATLQTFGQNAVATIVPAITGIVTAFQALGASAASTFAPQIQQAMGIVQGVVGQVVPFVQGLLTQMGAFFTTTFGTLIAWVTANMPLIQQTITTVLTAIQAIWNAVWPVMQQVVMLVWEQIKTFVTAALNIVLGIIKAVMQAINGDWAGAWETFKGVLTTAWEAIKTLITNYVAGMVGILTGAKGDFINAGKELINGLIEGAKAMAGNLIASVKGVVQDAINAAKALLGIHSPSTVFIEIGQQMMAGMGEGIDLNESRVIERIANAVKDIVSAFRNMLNITSEFGTPGALPDLGPWMDQLAAIFMQVADRLENMIAVIGYNRFNKLKLTARRMKEVLEVVLIDLGAIKARTLPDLGVWFGQLQDVFQRAMIVMNAIYGKWGTAVIQRAAMIAGLVGQVLSVLSTNLVPGEVGDNFAATLDKWMAAADLATDKLLTSLLALREKWGTEALDAAATIATQIGAVLALLATPMETGVIQENFGSMLTTWLTNVETATDQIIPKLQGMADKWGNAALDAASAIASKIGGVVGILSTKLEVGEISGSFAADMVRWLAQVEMATNQIIPKLQAIETKWGAEVLTAAAKTAGTLKSVLEILGVNLKLEVPTGDFGKKLTNWLTAFETATTALIAKLLIMQAALPSDMSGLMTFVASLGGLWKAIADGFAALREMIKGGGVNLGTLQALLTQWNAAAALAATAQPVAPAPAAGAEQGAGNGAALAAGAVGGGVDGVIRLHIMMGDQFMQEVTLRLSQLLGSQQDIYIQAGLDGAVS